MTARMVAFLAIGGAFAILGPTWPALKSKFPRRLSASFVGTASDFRWWVIALLFGLIGPALIGHSRHRPLLIPDDRELPETYPDAEMFGSLPVYARYARHVVGLTVSNLAG